MRGSSRTEVQAPQSVAIPSAFRRRVLLMGADHCVLGDQAVDTVARMGVHASMYTPSKPSAFSAVTALLAQVL